VIPARAPSGAGHVSTLARRRAGAAAASPARLPSSTSSVYLSSKLSPFATQGGLRLALAAALLVLAPAPAPARGAARDGRRTLSVAAAANLEAVLPDLQAAFEAERPGAAVRLTLGASGSFFAQIRNGAPFDVFLSADAGYPRQLVRAGLAREEDLAVYATGTLAVWAPARTRLDLEGRGLAALADPALRKLAVANPALAPYGRAAEAALRAAGILPLVKDRLVLGESVGQAAQFAQSGAADAALVPLSLTFAPALRGGKVLPVPAGLYAPQPQAAVALAGARDPELARAFLRFLVGPAGRAVLSRYGYGPP
jgi:molybdate transport system substrate-binding protein